MEPQEILNEIDGIIQTIKGKDAPTNEEMEFFGQLKKRTEDVDAFFKRLQKNARIGKGN